MIILKGIILVRRRVTGAKVVLRRHHGLEPDLKVFRKVLEVEGSGRLGTHIKCGARTRQRHKKIQVNIFNISCGVFLQRVLIAC